MGNTWRNPRRVQGLTFPLVFPLFLLVATIPFGSTTEAPATRVWKYSGSSADPDLLAAPFAGVEVVFPLRRGETLSQVLSGAGMPASDASEVARALGTSDFSLRSLRAGMTLGLARNSAGTVERLRLDFGERGSLVVGLGGTEPVVGHEELEIETRQRVVAGVIAGSLVESIERAGGDDQLVASLAQVFRWDVNFYRDLNPGDTFRVLYEARSARGEELGSGAVIAAELSLRDRTRTAYRFERAGGSEYLNADGRPLRKTFLKSPIRFARISSRFSKSRLHPVLGIWRPHYGVDFAAPAGTPVMATADGVVARAGWSGGGGNVIRLRHGGNVETFYLHLSRFAKGVQRGARVRQGEVIGFVGSTGLATAAHLDYRIEVNGKYRDPLAVKELVAEPLPAGERALFVRHRQHCDALLAAAASAPADSSSTIVAASRGEAPATAPF